MDTFWTILIDIGVLSVFALIYYLIQRRRILTFSLEEIFIHADELIYLCHEQIDNLKKANEDNYQHLETFVEALEVELESEEVDSLKDFLIHHNPDTNNEDIKSLFDDLKIMVGLNPSQ